MILKPEHGKTILVIPDPHDMPGVNQERFSFLGHLEKDIKPDFTVCIGDWPDLASLCSYEKGLKRAYNYRYSEDIESCNRSLDLFHAPTRAAKKRLPKRFMMKGNHDQRIDWAIEQDPQRFEGVISDRDLGFEDNGWEYIRYEGSNPGILELEGIAFSHFFTFGPMNRPIGGMYHAMNLLRKKAVSCIQGHTHFRDQASITDAFGKHLNAVVAGCAFEHFAEYAGANNYSFWRGVVVLTGVENGQFDASWVSLKTLRSIYG